jgi:AhpD family alkylhydroperoxidase
MVLEVFISHNHVYNFSLFYAILNVIYSPRGVGAKLALDAELSQGVFNGLPKEVIALAIAQVNGCNYCLAAHTAVAKMRGASEAETLNFRRGTSSDKKLAALAALAQEITESRGHPSQQAVEQFFAVGYDRAALVELIGLVALNVWNNYTNHMAQTPVDFPPAPELA